MNRNKRFLFVSVFSAVCVSLPLLADLSVWVGGTENWNAAANWSPEGVPNSSSVSVQVDGGNGDTASVVTVDLSLSVGGLAVDADDEVVVGNARTLTVYSTGGLANAGTVRVNGVNSTTRLIFNGGQTVVGAGQIVMSDYVNNYLSMAGSSDVLLLPAGHTIRGAGQLLGNIGNLVNHGLIVAQGNTALRADPYSFLTNNGVLRAEGGGDLTLSVGLFANGGGVIEALDGSCVTLQSSATVEGGTLQTFGSGRILPNTGVALDGVTLAAGSVLEQANNQNVTVLNGLVNNAVWNVSGSSISTLLLFSGSQTLEGSGVIVLSDYSNNILRPVGTGQTLAHAAGHTIRGAGQLLANYGNMVNNGTILAQGATALTLDPSTEFVNAGVLRAEGSGGLTLGAGVFVNTNRTIEVADGSRLTIMNSATVVGGTLQTSGSGRIRPNTGASLDGVTLAAGTVVEQANNWDVTVFNDLVNNGEWDMSGSSASTILLFSGSQTLGGSGELVLSDSTYNMIRPSASVGQMLTHAAGHTIRGAGQILANYSDMVNYGTILAQGNVALTIDPNPSFINSGVLRAEGAGGFVFAAGTFTNAGNTVEILDGSKLVLASSSTVVGGSLKSVGTGRVFPGNNSTLEGVTVDAGSVVAQANNVDVTLRGGLVNNAVWAIEASSAVTYLFYSGSQTLSGTGELVTSDSANNYIRAVASGQTLTQAAGHTIRGSGNLLNNIGNMVNQGTILAQGGAALTIDPLHAFVNEGVVRAEGSGGLAFGGGAFTNAGQTLQILNGSKLTLANTSTLYGGTLESVGTGRIIPASGVMLDGVTLAAGSVLTQDNNVDVTIRNGLVNDGTWFVEGGASTTYFYFNGSQTLSGTGELSLNNSLNNQIRPFATGQTLTQAAGHTIRGSGNLLYNYGNFINYGTLLAVGSAGMRIDPQLYFRNESSGVLGGTGTFVFVNDLKDNKGTLAPGLSVGTLTIDGDVANASSAVLDIELGGVGAGESDLLIVQGALSLNGDLYISLVNGFIPDAEDTFQIVSATGLSGAFANAVPAEGNTATNVLTGFGSCDVTYDYDASPKTVTISNVKSDPTLLRVVDIEAAPVAGTVTFAPSATNWLYTLQYRDSLTEGDWQNVPGQGPRPGIGRRDTMTDTNAPAASGFYRVWGEPAP